MIASRYILLGIAAVGWAGVAAASGPAAPLTIEAIMSSPFPTELRVAPNGHRIAWVSNDRGARNIWIADSGTHQARPLTHFTGDDGNEIGALSWMSGQRAVAFTRGGSLEGGGPVNPTNASSGPTIKHVYVQPLAGGAPRDLGPGDSPAPSPASDQVAFVRDGQIWLARLPSGQTRQLIHDAGTADKVTWSPDGRRLAFVSHRKAHALLGVYDLARDCIQWMSPSADTDTGPAWSPDGQRIAWIRSTSPDPTFEGYATHREGPPWSIQVGDPATGESHIIWRAPAGRGSVFHAIEDGSVLFWNGDQLIFPWEGSGWVRLYSVSAAGGQPAPLSPDLGEVFAVANDPAGHRVIFSSNAGDDDHRHLWAVSASSGPAHMLTSGSSIEDLPVVAAEGAIFALHSTGRDPLQPVALDRNGAVDPLVSLANFPRDQLVEPQKVLFGSADGLTLHGQLFLPTAGDPGRHPAVLFFHGGPQRQMLLGWHPMGAYSHLYAMNQLLASQGIVVLSVNFRGGTGYGLDFREAPDFAEAGGSEVRDIAAAVRYVKSRADVDPAKVAVYGMSYGGVMTSLALSKLPGEFVAGVDIAGVHDWKTFLPYLTAPGAPPEPAEVAVRSSAISSVAAWTAPVLLVHGDDDRAVDFSQTVELVRALRKVGKVEPEQFVLPGEVHDFIRYQSWVSVFCQGDAFLLRHLESQH